MKNQSPLFKKVAGLLLGVLINIPCQKYITGEPFSFLGTIVRPIIILLPLALLVKFPMSNSFCGGVILKDKDL